MYGYCCGYCANGSLIGAATPSSSVALLATRRRMAREA
jgi:hypothetical protein